MSRTLMILGTASGVGKSTITTGICRILHQNGYRVAPFKSQNMSCCSHVLSNGLEMARSQVIEAWACEAEPLPEMNPVLLKPVNQRSDVFINGRFAGNMGYHEYKTFKQSDVWDAVMQSYRHLETLYDLIVLEGAGSPVEMNLKHDDIANMNMAKRVGAPIVLIADIERGGVFASVKGTLDLLDDDERSLVKGIIINKCIGNIDHLFDEVRETIEKITTIPVIGTVPYLPLDIDDEDSLYDMRTGLKPTKNELSETEQRELLRVQFDMLANHLRKYLNLQKIDEIIGLAT